MIGNTNPPGATSYKQTALGIIPRAKLLPLELEGVKKGLEFIHRQIKTSRDVEITSQLICKLHAVSFKWIFPGWAGKFRTIQVTYSNKEAPAYFQIPELSLSLCDDLEVQLKNLPQTKDDNYIEQVVDLLAWFQHRFVFIHPFQDYNGRTARMLTVLILLKLGLPAVELQINSDLDRKKYLQAMQQGDAGDLSLLEKLISNSLADELSV